MDLLSNLYSITCNFFSSFFKESEDINHFLVLTSDGFEIYDTDKDLINFVEELPQNMHL